MANSWHDRQYSSNRNMGANYSPDDTSSLVYERKELEGTGIGGRAGRDGERFLYEHSYQSVRLLTRIQEIF